MVMCMERKPFVASRGLMTFDGPVNIFVERDYTNQGTPISLPCVTKTWEASYQSTESRRKIFIICKCIT